MKNTKYKNILTAATTLLMSVTACNQAISQTLEVPTAGQILKQTLPEEYPLKISENQSTDIPSPSLLKEQPGGMKVQLTSIQFSGNTVYSNSELATVIGDIRGQEFDLGQLRGLANVISEHYRNNGYLFAKGFLPAQQLNNGVLNIAIAEGYYGDVRIEGEAEIELAGFVNPLSPGSIIRAKELQQTVSILHDIPGFSIKSLMKPGAIAGTGDLIIDMDKVAGRSSFVSLDNYGSRYIGPYRLMGYVGDNNVLSAGDQLQGSILISNEHLLFGSLNYDRLVGYKGMRMGMSLLKTDYQIAEIDASLQGLDAQGIARVTALNASYPLVRDKQQKVDLQVQLKYKQFTDTSIGISASKNALVVPMSVHFNWQDAFSGGGITYGRIEATVGDLTIQTLSAREQDQRTANTQGFFSKLNIDISRLQKIDEKLTLFAHVQGQWSNTNLDSSEDMSLGGAQSVRAFPSGEAASDKALMSQIEIRYAMGEASAFVFYDVAMGWKNAKRWDPINNRRTLSGIGIGVRASYKELSYEVTAAKRLVGGASQSDNTNRSPMLWANFRHAF